MVLLNVYMGLFTKKSPLQKLEKAYKEKLAKAHEMSHRDRTASDKLLAEAEEIAQKIDALRAG